MKKNLATIVFGVVLLGGCAAYGPSGEIGAGYASPGGYGEVSIGFFYDYLSPYGTWVEFSPYGFVWCPTYLGYGWRPYTNGHWVWTDYGWTWLSDYDWGWVPFHYGRWDWDDGLGWYWVPDTIWGPAWVTWSWSDMYIGWAPLTPGVHFVAGVGISAFSSPYPARYWCFIEGSHFLDPGVSGFIMPYERNTTIINYTINRSNITVVNNRVYNGGMGVDEVRRVTRREVRQYRLEDAREPGRQRVEGGMVRMYRPPVVKSEAARPKAFVLRSEAPQKLEQMRRQGGEGRGRVTETEKRVQEGQKKERKLLDQGQRAEREQVRRQGEAATKRAASAAEKERITKEAQVKRNDVEKKHVEEKAQMQRRHQEEQKKAGGQQQQKGSKPQQKPTKKKG